MPEAVGRLIEKVRVTGRLLCLTGLHIGGTESPGAIGAPDKLVVRLARNRHPYIPGSSLKGKVRSLVERAGLGMGGQTLTIDEKGKCGPCSDPTTLVGQLFGTSAEQKAGTRCASRVIFRDAPLDKDVAEKMLHGEQEWRLLGGDYTELKTEVSIDRLTSAANPRTFERVPAGAVFKAEFVVDLFEGDPRVDYFQLLRDGFELLAADYIGGQGSRGYGAVEFEVAETSRLDIAALRAGGTVEWQTAALSREGFAVGARFALREAKIA